MIECPECGQTVRGSKCRCGWDVPKPQRQAQGNPLYGCCDWIGDWQCHYPGVFKHGDRLLCRHHDGCTDPITGAQIVEQSHADIPHPDYSHAAIKARSLAEIQKKAAEFSALGSKRKAA